jgi:hypothetical protein
MRRPGKGEFLIGVKEPVSDPVGRAGQTVRS